ncbi:Endonuclease/Exonuclease/phosphatase family protein [Maioricimonas rarisocia]|uniref:Endonuclease/Exonuclease/phosphatase family protein n=1 Tax=Maioricimonas rarisocia TaxID=2528026 RepID=A0A517Z842_9PLAN|nr:endonuclease/exonuclease/phosphatase family protein [Maioricimonas rarisocia]QDU38662.1 Endonuclease/Exonuclease/phosphatase family protein [Maioricimonas rarisocia]
MTNGDTEIPTHPLRNDRSARVYRWSRRGIGALSLLLVVVGVLLHATVRDRWVVTSLFYYSLPPIVIALLGGMAVWSFWSDMSSRIGQMVALGGVLLLAGWSQAHAWRLGSVPEAAAEDVRVVFWNTCRLSAGKERIARAVGRLDADIIALCEAGEATEKQRALWQSACPGYDVTFLGGGMIVLTRGVSGEARAYSLSYHTEARQLELELPAGRVTCLLVDVASSPTYSRRPALRELAEIAETMSDRPLLILGDFNTPGDSVLFRPLRREHANAFEQTGRGFGPTWPVPLPVLDIDQIWSNRKVDIRNCQIGWEWVSDHRPVYASVRLRSLSGSSDM